MIYIAERRMFAKTIVLSDDFLDMPMSARCLYFTLGMLADDDGFVNSPKSIMRQCGSSEDDFRVLMAKRFLLKFDDGVIVIKHWRIHNYIQKDRYKPTLNQEDKALLTVNKNGEYELEEPCIHSGYIPDTQDRLGKDRLGKDRNTSAPVEAIPLNDGTEWLPSMEEYEEYKRLYPNVDVDQEFRKMRGWCNDNPSKKKTLRGIKRFVGGWLSREQDKPRMQTRAPSWKRQDKLPDYYDANPNRADSGEKVTDADIAEARSLLEKLKIGG